MFLGEEDNLVLQEIGERQNKRNQTLSFGGKKKSPNGN